MLEQGLGQLFIFMLFQLQFFFSLKANIDSEFGREFPIAANLLHFLKIFQKKV